MKDTKKFKEYKIILVGNSGSGKTTFLENFFKLSYETNIQPTIGAALKVYKDYNNKIKYNIWDTAGQERYSSLLSLYYRNADIIFIFYDLSIDYNGDSIMKWIDNIKYYIDNPYIVIIANKTDLLENLPNKPNNIPDNIKWYLSTNYDIDNIQKIFEESILPFKNKSINEKYENEKNINLNNDDTYYSNVLFFLDYC